MRKLAKNDILLPYRNNPSEETNLEVLKLRTNMKQRNLKMKKLCPQTLKTLMNELNRPVSELVKNISEKTTYIIVY